jgi:uncharacterized ferredoxin-like protein
MKTEVSITMETDKTICDGHTCIAKYLIAGIGIMAAKKKPQAFVMDVKVMLGPTSRRVDVTPSLMDVFFILSSFSKKASPMTNMSSTPKPRTRNGRT